MSDSQLRSSYARLMFYVRERYWHHAEELCATVAASSDDWTFRVWRALTLDQQGLYNEALKEYRTAQHKRQVALPALMGIMLIHKRSKDAENVAKVELQLQDAETTASEADLLDGRVQCAAMAWAYGDVNAARDITAKIPEKELENHTNEYTNAATIKGWVDLSTGRGALLEKCGQYFQKAMELMSGAGVLDADAALGRVAYLERKFQLSPAQELLNKLVVAYPSFTPALVTKVRLLMRAEDWDQALETTRRVLLVDKTDVEALSLQALHALVKDARPAAATQYLGALLDATLAREPRNAALMAQFAQVFSRLASGVSGGAPAGGTSGSASAALAAVGGATLQLLSITGKFAERACTLDPRNGAYLTEVGRESLYRGEYKEAIATFQKAASMTESLEPLLGTVACLIQQGKLDDAAKQCALCNELHRDAARSAELQLLNGRLAWRQQRDERRSLQFLDQSVEAVKQDIQSLSGANGLELYVRVNVPLMLEIAREYSQHCRSEPPDPVFRHPDPIGEKIRKHLEVLLRHVPGCMAAQIMLARVSFISGDVKAAEAILRECLLQREQPLPEGFLLSAQICQYTGNTKLAKQALEQALTLDFEMKDQPLYNVLSGVVLASTADSSSAGQAQLQKALEAFQLAMSIVKNADRVTEKGRAIEPLAVPDHVTLYLQMAQVHLRLRDADEARKLLSECAVLFRDTAQAGRVAIAQSMLVARTDVESSIELLRQVPATSDFYVAARTQMAKLYLVHLMDPVKYTECFEELVKQRPTPQGYVELGEAYTTVQDPEKAVAAYEKAKAMDPKNSELAVRVGRALVSTHDYKRSIQFYEDALAADERLFSVRADLAMLYWRLGDVAMAVQTLKECPQYITAPSATEPTITAIERVNCAMLLFKVQRGAGASAAAAEALLQAHTYQAHVLESRLRNESRETMLQQKAIIASILTELGRHYTQIGEGTKAKEYLAEALKFDDAFEPAILALAHLSLDEDAATAMEKKEKNSSNNNNNSAAATAAASKSASAEQCEQRCQEALRINPDCEEAVVMLTTLMMRQPDRGSEAKQLFEKLLENNPTNYDALVQYIQLMRNTGDMAGVEAAVDRAVSLAPANQRQDPGLSFVQGMAQHYGNANADALRSFNRARLPADNPWCERALKRMIGIYLVPTTVDVWADNWSVDEKTDNVRCAEQLLLLLPAGDDRRVLEGFCLLATKRKPDVEKATHRFLEVIKAAQPQTDAESAAAASAEQQRKQKEEEERKKRAAAAAAGDDVDEDDLLLDEMKNAPLPGDSSADSATLAEALSCRVVHIPAFLGLAIALYLSDQERVARNLLLRIVGSDDHTSAPTTTQQQDQQHADELERARLFYAFLCVRSNTLDEAQQHLQEVLRRNQSCSSAWDALAALHERQQRHSEASQCFQRAWKLVKESDPAVGYKLAFNYLKGNDPVRALDVSRTVLERHAGYPRIEEDVMDPAFAMLRP